LGNYFLDNSSDVTIILPPNRMQNDIKQSRRNFQRYQTRFERRRNDTDRSGRIHAASLPILGEIPSQGTPFETVISHLAASQIPRLATCLESILTASQKDELLWQL
jgi:hypothetical protein